MSGDGEIPGVRDARDRLRESMQQGGLPSGWSDRKADEAARRLDRNIRDGRVKHTK
jgi:hypothetical protein